MLFSPQITGDILVISVATPAGKTSTVGLILPKYDIFNFRLGLASCWWYIGLAREYGV